MNNHNVNTNINSVRIKSFLYIFAFFRNWKVLVRLIKLVRLIRLVSLITLIAFSFRLD